MILNAGNLAEPAAALTKRFNELFGLSDSVLPKLDEVRTLMAKATAAEQSMRENLARNSMFEAKDHFKELRAAISMAGNCISAELRKPLNPLPNLPMLTAGEMERELAGLVRDYAEVEYRPHATSAAIVVLSEPYISSWSIYKAAVGRLRFGLVQSTYMASRDESAFKTCTIVEKTPWSVCSKHGKVHPHVYSGHICLGNGSPVLREACRTGRLRQAFDIMHAILSDCTASHDIEHWADSTCRICGCRLVGLKLKNAIACSSCGLGACWDCRTTCSVHGCLKLVCVACTDNAGRCRFCTGRPDPRPYQQY